MNRRMFKSLPLLLLLCLTLFTAACGTDEEGTAAPSLKPGATAPDFTLTTMSNQTVTLSELRGQKVFLNFWASWCPPCKQEMPALQELSRKYEGKVKLYGVNIASEDQPDLAEQFVLEQRLTFPQLVDTEEGTVKKAYGAISVPISVTIDENGKIVEHRIGQLSHEQAEAMFQKLLQANQKP